MKLSAPKKATFIIALLLIVAGIVGKLGRIAFLVKAAFWLVVVGAVILLLANIFKGL